jgi:hypothetical protein
LYATVGALDSCVASKIKTVYKRKMMRNRILALGMLIMSMHSYAHYLDEGMYFCTSTDAYFFGPAVNLIASLHKTNFDSIRQIAVFDLGMTQEQRQAMQRLAKVIVCDPEKINPLMLDDITGFEGKKIRGHYTWKPVVIKQALDMFPYLFYIDAGITVVGKFDTVFEYIREYGYFFVDCNHSIRQMTIRSVIERCGLTDALLDSYGLSVGHMGVSRMIYDSYVMPVYQYAHDPSYFIDDGTTPKGYGWIRPEQALYSMQARLQGMTIFEGMIAGMTCSVLVHGKHVTFHLYSLLRHTRFSFDWNNVKDYLRMK